MQVKTIDWRSKYIAAEFAESIRETGFAVISNHPIEFDLIESAFSEWEEFFKSDKKFDYTFDPKTQAGYFPFKSENARNSDFKDLKEFFHHYEWSELPPQCSKFTPKLKKQMEDLGVNLLKGLDEVTPVETRKHFSIPLHSMTENSDSTLLRAIHYPPLTEPSDGGSIRAAAHEDINLITILPAATEPGLQVRDRLGGWHEVSCDPGTLAVNAGDMLMEASRGYYPSTTHQVVNPQGEKAFMPRYSMPLFIHPRSDVVLSERYTADQYLKQRLKELGLL